MFRTVTYRLYPTAGQASALVRLLGSQRELYNAALEERRGRWRWNCERVTWVDQFKGLTGARAEIPSLGEFGLAPHRGTLKRLDEAFAGFFRRVNAGEAPGFPRFKSAARFDSVTYPTDAGWRVYVPEGAKGTYGRLRLKGVGHIRIKLHRHLPGAVPAKLVVRRTGCGRRVRWEATVFYKNVTPRPAPPPTGLSCGVDRGVTVLAAVAASDGTVEHVDNPRHLDQARAALARKQARLARALRGSNRRDKLRSEVVALHRRVRDARKDRNHQLSRRLVDAYDLIALEALATANMVRTPAAKPDPDNAGGFLANGAAAKAGLNRSILDAGWAQLATMIAYKAEEAGRRVVVVNPQHTSQMCSHCRHIDRANRDGTVFWCRLCGHRAHADTNAAINILHLAGTRPGSGHARFTA